MLESREIGLLLKMVILHSLQNINDERTINSIYYLLTGKQSIQTIQDAHLFQLERYFSLYKGLRVEEFHAELPPLLHKQYIERCEDNKFIVTARGEEIIQQANLYQYHWNGMAYGQFDEQFIHRLFLMIQVWTNRKVNINRYIPIVEDAEIITWVKSFYHQQESNVESHLQQLYEELTAIFSELDDTYPRLFIKQLTTAKTIGLTNEQLADYFNKSILHVHLLQKNYLHYILKIVSEQAANYPLLFKFAQDFLNEARTNIMTKSAQVTAQLVEHGVTPELIARHRNLRITTIYDHIVEIALHDERFPMENFVSIQKQREVYEAVKKLNSFKLKDIKELVNEEITYFHIRLALTKLKQIQLDEVIK